MPAIVFHSNSSCYLFPALPHKNLTCTFRQIAATYFKIRPG